MVYIYEREMTGQRTVIIYCIIFLIQIPQHMKEKLQIRELKSFMV